jgi:hypothetical protein
LIDLFFDMNRTTSGSVSSAAVQQRLFASSSSARAASSLWAHLDVAPLDSNHATNAAFEAVRTPHTHPTHTTAHAHACAAHTDRAIKHNTTRHDTQDQSPLKVNLGRGVYKDDNGKNWVLPSVRMAEEKIFAEKAGHDYLPFKGWDVFCKRTSEFAFGETNPLLKDKRVATVQAISGTGARCMRGMPRIPFSTHACCVCAVCVCGVWECEECRSAEGGRRVFVAFPAAHAQGRVGVRGRPDLREPPAHLQAQRLRDQALPLLRPQHQRPRPQGLRRRSPGLRPHLSSAQAEAPPTFLSDWWNGMCACLAFLLL